MPGGDEGDKLLRQYDARLDSVEFGIGAGDPVGVLSCNYEPGAVALLDDHGEDAHARLARGAVFIAIALQFPAPVQKGGVGMEESDDGVTRGV